MRVEAVALQGDHGTASSRARERVHANEVQRMRERERVVEGAVGAVCVEVNEGATNGGDVNGDGVQTSRELRHSAPNVCGSVGDELARAVANHDGRRRGGVCGVEDVRAGAQDGFVKLEALARDVNHSAVSAAAVCKARDDRGDGAEDAKGACRGRGRVAALCDKAIDLQLEGGVWDGLVRGIEGALDERVYYARDAARDRVCCAVVVFDEHANGVKVGAKALPLNADHSAASEADNGRGDVCHAVRNVDPDVRLWSGQDHAVVSAEPDLGQLVLLLAKGKGVAAHNEAGEVRPVVRNLDALATASATERDSGGVPAKQRLAFRAVADKLRRGGECAVEDEVGGDGAGDLAWVRACGHHGAVPVVGEGCGRHLVTVDGDVHHHRGGWNCRRCCSCSGGGGGGGGCIAGSGCRCGCRVCCCC